MRSSVPQLRRRTKCLDAPLDLGAIDHAGGAVAAGEAGDERLEALEAHVVEAAQFGDRLGMVVDAQIEARIVLGGMDAQCSRLLAALVAAGRVAGRERVEQ